MALTLTLLTSGCSALYAAPSTTFAPYDGQMNPVRVPPLEASPTPEPAFVSGVTATVPTRPPAPATEPKPVVVEQATPVARIGKAIISGKATWYAYHQGQAAAAKALRQILGPHWRGMTVIVAHGGRRVRVTLTDFESSQRPGALIDLDVRDFATLAPTSQGRISVTIELP